jgi:hypothetical protein
MQDSSRRPISVLRTPYCSCYFRLFAECHGFRDEFRMNAVPVLYCRLTVRYVCRRSKSHVSCCSVLCVIVLVVKPSRVLCFRRQGYLRDPL